MRISNLPSAGVVVKLCFGHMQMVSAYRQKLENLFPRRHLTNVYVHSLRFAWRKLIVERSYKQNLTLITQESYSRHCRTKPYVTCTCC